MGHYFLDIYYEYIYAVDGNLGLRKFERKEGNMDKNMAYFTSFYFLGDRARYFFPPLKSWICPPPPPKKPDFFKCVKC